MGAFAVRIGVRFRDLDALGHVNNAVFFTYFEETRKELFLKLSKATNLNAFPFIIAHVSCDYIRPIMLDTRLEGRIWVSDIGTKSFKLNYSLVDQADQTVVYAKGESVQVCFDYARSASMEIPPELREKLSGHLSAEPS